MRALRLLFTILLVSLAVREISMAQKPNGDASKPEQALIVHLRLSNNDAGTHEERERLFKLEDRLIDELEKRGVGEYDGNEIGGGEFTLYMYGSSTDQLWEVVSPIVKALPPPRKSYVIKRYGSPGAKEDRIFL